MYFLETSKTTLASMYQYLCSNNKATTGIEFKPHHICECPNCQIIYMEIDPSLVTVSVDWLQSLKQILFYF